MGKDIGTAGRAGQFAAVSVRIVDTREIKRGRTPQNPSFCAYLVEISSANEV